MLNSFFSHFNCSIDCYRYALQSICNYFFSSYICKCIAKKLKLIFKLVNEFKNILSLLMIFSNLISVFTVTNWTCNRYYFHQFVIINATFWYTKKSLLVLVLVFFFWFIPTIRSALFRETQFELVKVAWIHFFLFFVFVFCRFANPTKWKTCRRSTVWWMEWGRPKCKHSGGVVD